MSTVRTDLLTDRLGVKHPAVLKADFVKAWAVLSQTGTQTMPAQFNVASIADMGVGATRFNFTALFVSSNHAPLSINSSGASLIQSATGSYFQINNYSISASPALVDVGFVSYADCGDLA